MKTPWLLGLLAGLATPMAMAQPNPALLGNKGAFIADVLRQMTLDEKIGQLRLISFGPSMPASKLAEEVAAGRVGGSFGVVSRPEQRPLQDAAMQRSRMKIPVFFAYDVVHGHRTTFPIGLGLASSWDLEAVRLSARVAAQEASADGIDFTFAPTVDIARDPRWGRTSEGFGEDPHLVSQMARAMVKGFQNDSAAKPDSLMASVKHFALYGAVEGGRDYNIVDMSPMRMYNDYLPPYRAAIDAGSGGVMLALNAVNGVPAAANTWLLQDLLRKDWGFKGVTLSDHGAIAELLRHGVARDEAEAAKLAIKAGVDMSMADESYIKELPGLLKSGQVQEGDIDNAVREVLGAKYDMGLFRDPFLRIGKAEDDPADLKADSRLNRAPARDVARKSMVLLENRNRTLPLRKTGTIALVGPLADSPVDILGAWSAQGVPALAVTLRQGMAAAIGDKARLLFARGANVTEDRSIVDYMNYPNGEAQEIVQDGRMPQEMIDEAVATAKQADVVVAAVGESRGMSHESSSRTRLDLPESQQALLKALKATGRPLVLVLMNGRPLTLGWEKANADAMLETWFAGTEGGNAIADVLFGDADPSGKLPISLPRSVGQIPTYYNFPRPGRPFTPGKPGNYTSQYFDEPQGALYPFGYGLSYTDFTLSNLVLSSRKVRKGRTLEASVTVKNSGDRAGDAVVQLYIQDVVASVVRPVKELKGFRKLKLQPGETQVVRFPIGETMLSFYNQQLKRVAEPGAFNVQVGLDSRDVLQESFELLP
ncbi:beta-glucosidase BglX [Variovorax ginsengisoli]|uniref:Beta-glucosidase BglX n=1 Tax=Variovorax ginsengisoli TaxID=363844 RepID=A0ABT8S8M9_9BURK|nr:beta-glucosidase BglX [Variovorax ginsengisoli]MDN8616088.1 beta-glucosidase BglX [Variovorax ginsengisoli]MDO1535258.1 beta-glucosidase BglX [Variovorax ginsengisoli]